MKKATVIARKLRRSYSSTVTDEAADMLMDQEETIASLRQRIKELESNEKYFLKSLHWL